MRISVRFNKGSHVHQMTCKQHSGSSYLLIEPSSLTHGVAGLVKVNNSGLVSDHHCQGVDDTLAANATVSETLEGEVVWPS